MNPENIVLNRETHDSILGMMNSPDTENKVVALNCIENVDFNTNLTYIMILKRAGNATAAEWQEHAPKASKMLQGLGIKLDTALTWKQVLEILVKRNVPPEDIQFYLDRFAGQLFTSIKGLGYEFIDTLEIKLKVKTANGEQSRTISESVKGPHA